MPHVRNHITRRADRRLIFVRDMEQWERDRKRIVAVLDRLGYTAADRMSVSLALDEVIAVAFDARAHNGRRTAAMIAYSISAHEFRARVRLVPGDASGSGADGVAGDTGGDRDWLIASACMTGVRVDEGGTEVEMWRQRTEHSPALDQHSGWER